MIWIVVVCGLLGWTLVSLPLAVAVGRSFAAADRFDEKTIELPSPGFDAPPARRAGETGQDSAVA